MSDWVGILLIVVLLVAVVVLVVVLFTQWQEQEQKQKRASEELPVLTPEPEPVVSPVVKRRIVLRKPSAVNGKFQKRQVTGTTVKRKQILGNTQKTTTPITTDWFEIVPQSGKKIKAREVKIDLDEIHKLTGIPIRDCPCGKCEEMRANVGS